MAKKFIAGAAIMAWASAANAQAIAPLHSAQADYQIAFALTHSGTLDRAEQAWRDFLRSHPNDALAANAQYFLGETYFGRNDYSTAATTYTEGVEKYPKSAMASEMLLKAAISLGRAENSGAACDALLRLDRDFPSTTGVVRERAAAEKQLYHCSASAKTPPHAVTAAVTEPPTKAAEPVLKIAAKDSTLIAPAAPDTPASSAPPQAAQAIILPSVPFGHAPSPIVEATPPAVPVPPVTREKLAAAHDSRQTSPAPSADLVKASQTLLIALGYYVGPADGEIGPKLRRAIRAFQLRTGLRADGDVSDTLLQQLSIALASKSGATAKSVTPVAAIAPLPVATIKPEANRDRAAGTGFVISKSGYVITSHSLVANCGEIQTRSIASESLPAAIVAFDTRNDLALLRLKAPASTAAIFRDGRGPRQGEGVVVTGFALSNVESAEFHLSTGVVSALTGARGDNGRLEVTAPMRDGYHGGPVFDMAGHVIGVVGGSAASSIESGIARDSGAALKASELRNFLDAHNVDYDAAASAAELKPAEIGDVAKSVLVQVECR